MHKLVQIQIVPETIFLIVFGAHMNTGILASVEFKHSFQVCTSGKKLSITVYNHKGTNSCSKKVLSYSFYAEFCASTLTTH